VRQRGFKQPHPSLVASSAEKVGKARKTVPKQNLEEVTMTVVTACRVFFPSKPYMIVSPFYMVTCTTRYGHMYNKMSAV